MCLFFFKPSAVAKHFVALSTNAVSIVNLVNFSYVPLRQPYLEVW